MGDKKIAKAGKLICIDSGQYSDYQVIGFFVVLKDFDPLNKLDEFLHRNPDQNEDYSFRYDQFLSSLISEGLLLEIEYDNLYMGSYGQSDVDFTPFSR